MLGVQCHNQVIFHLAQVSAGLTIGLPQVLHRSLSRIVSATENAYSLKSEDSSVQFRSLKKAAKSSSNELVKCLPKRYYSIPAPEVKMFVSLDPSKVRLAKVKGQVGLNKLTLQKWKHQATHPHQVSYCSTESFEKNKQQGFYNQLHAEKALLSFRLFTSSSFPPRLLQSFSQTQNFVQLRSFKSGRISVKEDDKRVFKRILSRFQPSAPPLTVEVKVPHADGQIPAETIEAIRKVYTEGVKAGRGDVKARFPKFWVFLGFTFFILASLSLFELYNSLFKPVKQGKASDLTVTFEDVRGVDEAKKDLQAIVEFLKYPEKFEYIGAKLPTGILLCGPPGTGKTLLARAVAGEAGVPFFYASGSEFDEGLVGDGARKVRNLFHTARLKAPCVIFLDELDSIGSTRTSSRYHPYANQTINQLLTEMDGFTKNKGVIVLAATNRRFELDEALVRPGRFDMEVTVPCPKEDAREDLLRLYLSKVVNKDVDLGLLAKKTAGFTGAAIATMINMAAINAAVQNSKHVTMTHIFEAFDRVTVGTAWTRKAKNTAVERVTAYHEGGHTLVAWLTKHSGCVDKVTIQARGETLGHTTILPKEDPYTKCELIAVIDMLLGGRAAEEMMFGSDGVSTGCASDLKKASDLAMDMVKKFGMGGSHLSVMKDDYKELSNETRKVVDAEINRILEESQDRVRALLIKHKADLEKVAENLLKYETLTADDLTSLIGPPARIHSETTRQPRPESQDLTHFSVPEGKIRPNVNSPSVL